MEKHVWRLHYIPPGYHLVTIGMEIRNQENVGFFISDGTQHVRAISYASKWKWKIVISNILLILILYLKKKYTNP